MLLNTIEKQMQQQYKYKKYIVGTSSVRQKLKQMDNKGNAITKQNDTVDISKSGRNALEKKIAALCKAKQDKYVQKLSSVSSLSIINDFEKAVSEEKKEKAKSNTFDYHINQMVSAYKQIQNSIEEKYANIDREQQYYITDNGSIQELTKEKELEMLHKAYEKHSQFMATSTEIWSNLQNFKPQIIYHSKDTSTVTTQRVFIDITKKGNIKEQVHSGTRRGECQS